MVRLQDTPLSLDCFSREDLHKTMGFPTKFLGISDDCWFVINPIPWFSIESSHVEGPYGGISY